MKKIAQLLGVSEDLLREAKYAQDLVFIKKRGSITPEAVDSNRILEIDLLRWLLLFGKQEGLTQLIMKNIAVKDLQNPICQKLYVLYLESYESQLPYDLLSLGVRLEGEEEQSFLTEMLQKKVNGEKAKEGCIHTMKKILERNWLYERETIKTKIQSGGGTEEEVYALVKKFDELTKTPPIVQLLA
ncbi:MAG: hypothetical protein FJZ63_03865 [Chlamydiae bacterium]|nr:hypothetical protein [Chlamydiota bacterium]